MYHGKLIGLFIALTTMSACTTLEESMRLGATAGMLTGVAATYAVEGERGNRQSFERASAAGTVGLAIGMLIAYVVHNEVIKDRAPNPQVPELYFGDLPPNPFIFPNPTNKKGAHE